MFPCITFCSQHDSRISSLITSFQLQTYDKVLNEKTDKFSQSQNWDKYLPRAELKQKKESREWNGSHCSTQPYGQGKQSNRRSWIHSTAWNQGLRQVFPKMTLSRGQLSRMLSYLHNLGLSNNTCDTLFQNINIVLMWLQHTLFQ